ncbi:MAG: hypothetical protein RMJ51_06705 [Candidatus Calescibacterium sp.]|nr:hypothetical protein [Candidatus Calescibacterium sp.]MCX7758411.1 hypothetical protein [bacterium]MDW8195905.1 hypothetical protein [Candidatus Calescibacterium sp.]
MKITNNNYTTSVNMYYFHTTSNQVNIYNNININIQNIDVQNNLNIQNDAKLRIQLQWILLELLFILLGGEDSYEWHRVLNDYGRYVTPGMNSVLFLPEYSSPEYVPPTPYYSPSIPSINHPNNTSHARYNHREESNQIESNQIESNQINSNIHNFDWQTGVRREIEGKRSAEVSLGNTSIRGEISGKAEGYAEILGRGTISDTGLYGRVEARAGARGNVSSKVEVRRGDVSAYGKAEVGAGVEAKGSAEVIAGRGIYGEASIGASARIEEGIEKGLKVQDSGISAGVKKYKEARAEVGAKFGYGVARDKDEIVSKGGLHVSAQASVSVGADFHVQAENSDGYIKGSIGIEAGIGKGFSVGAGTEARINTKNWNVTFNTFVDLGIGLVADLDFNAAIEGQISINREISELRNELNQQIQQKEQQLLQNEINIQNSQAVKQQKVDKKPQIDRNKIRQRAKEIVLNNTPNWQSRLAIIHKNFENKAKNILTDFSRKLIDRAVARLERIENNQNKKPSIWSNVTHVIKGVSSSSLKKLKGLLNFTGGIASKILSLITPSVRSAIYEIKPHDVIKS